MGLIGYPIVTVMYGITLIGIASWILTKQGRLFLSRFIREKQDEDTNKSDNSYGKENNSNSFDSFNGSRIKRVVNNKSTNTECHYSKNKKKRRKFSHNTLPRREL